MTEHFNGLTPKEDELLELLTEECGELVAILGKIKRHGLHSYHPDTFVTNHAALIHEMGDVRAAMIMICRAGIADKMAVHNAADNKLVRVKRYLHHQDDEA